jgi:hypothetical protein
MVGEGGVDVKRDDDGDKAVAVIGAGSPCGKDTALALALAFAFALAMTLALFI